MSIKEKLRSLNVSLSPYPIDERLKLLEEAKSGMREAIESEIELLNDKVASDQQRIEYLKDQLYSINESIPPSLLVPLKNKIVNR